MIYIVKGQTGEYDSAREWNVIAFNDKEEAEKHANLAQEFAANALSIHKNWCDIPTEHKNPYDLYMQIDFSGTIYTVEELELI